MLSKLSLRILLLLSTTSIVFWACQPKNNPNYSQYEENSFETFYERFHKDSQFQMERIHFPLAGLPGMADSSSIVSGNYFHQKQNWVMLKYVNWDTIQGFNRVLEDSGLGVLDEYICTQDHFCIVRRFAQLSNGWHLVYYANMNYRPDLR